MSLLRVTVFELFACDRLTPSFKPAFLHILTVLSDRYAVLRWLGNVKEEFFYWLLYRLEAVRRSFGRTRARMNAHTHT